MVCKRENHWRQRWYQMVGVTGRWRPWKQITAHPVVQRYSLKKTQTRCGETSKDQTLLQWQQNHKPSSPSNVPWTNQVSLGSRTNQVSLGSRSNQVSLGSRTNQVSLGSSPSSKGNLSCFSFYLETKTCSSCSEVILLFSPNPCCDKHAIMQ